MPRMNAMGLVGIKNKNPQPFSPRVDAAHRASISEACPSGVNSWLVSQVLKHIRFYADDE
jgi:hypothetical protein